MNIFKISILIANVDKVTILINILKKNAFNVIQVALHVMMQLLVQNASLKIWKLMIKINAY